MTVASAVAVELLRAQPETYRAGDALSALQHAAGRMGIDLVTTQAYRGASPWLLFWGPGAPARAAIMRQHVAAGGRAIALDLAYWNRGAKTRISIDAAHPQAWVMRSALSSVRFTTDLPRMGNLWRENGPVLIAGIGKKAQAQYGAETVDAWEDQMAAACRARWPRRAIVRRPKPLTVGPPVDGALNGASLVITWHSNVAVDAIRLGIPVVCRDGAAAAVCPPELPDEPRPLSAEIRDRFLSNLAWFQWAPSEAEACWTFLAELLA